MTQGVEIEWIPMILQPSQWRNSSMGGKRHYVHLWLVGFYLLVALWQCTFGLGANPYLGACRAFIM